MADMAPQTSMSMSSPSQRFHPWHGENIDLSVDGTVAHRRSCFAHAITFSDQPLRANEIFMVEIERVENGWNGHLRIGLTSLDPNDRPILPRLAMPEINTRGIGWVYAVSRANTLYDGISGELHFSSDSSRRIPEVCSHERLPTDVGSNVGVYYEVSNGHRCGTMHLLIDGQDLQIDGTQIPLDSGPLYALVDVYGATKQVRVIPNSGSYVKSLQNLCRNRILQSLNFPRNVDRLPLPSYLLDYVREGSLPTCVPLEQKQRLDLIESLMQCAV